jgi:hypothetical protein
MFHGLDAQTRLASQHHRAVRPACRHEPASVAQHGYRASRVQHRMSEACLNGLCVHCMLQPRKPGVPTKGSAPEDLTRAEHIPSCTWSGTRHSTPMSGASSLLAAFMPCATRMPLTHGWVQAIARKTKCWPAMPCQWGQRTPLPTRLMRHRYHADRGTAVTEPGPQPP